MKHDYSPIRLSTHAEFEVNESLIERQKAAAEKLGPNSIKRVLIEDHEDTFVPMPVDYEDLPA